jgi:sugar lactone lactonase YvrE
MEHDMNRAFAVVVLSLAITACKKAEQPAAEPAGPPFAGLTVSDSFKTPESVLYDEAGDRYLVANINGNPAQKDNNGFISVVSPEGGVDSLAWIQGGRGGITLNAPKGMAIRGDTLFVADIDELRMFHRATGAALGSVLVPGATFLNDVSLASDGSLWFTDSGLKPDFTASGTDVVYHRTPSGGELHKVLQGASLGHPNGLLTDDEGVVVVTFGSGEVFRINGDGQRVNMPKPPHGQLDGVIRVGNRFIISSWEDSTLMSLASGDSSWTVLARGIPSPADIGFDSKRDRVLVPVFTMNRIEIKATTAPAAAPAH